MLKDDQVRQLIDYYTFQANGRRLLVEKGTRLSDLQKVALLAIAKVYDQVVAELKTASAGGAIPRPGSFHQVDDFVNGGSQLVDATGNKLHTIGKC